MSRRKRKGGTFNARPVQTYESIARICRARRASETPRGSGTSSYDNNGGREWDGGVEFDRVAGLLDAGWEAGNLAVAAVLDVHDADPSESGGWDLDVCGDYVSVPVYLSGMPDCMMRKEPGEAPRRVRLILSSGYSCFINASTAMEYAKACAAYAAGLMARGYDVAITSIQVTGCSGETVLQATTVKEYGQEPEAAKIAFCTHPAFLRRASFAVSEMDDGIPSDGRSGGYGSPCFVTSQGKAYALACIPDSGDERTLTLPPLVANGTKMEGFLKQFESDAVDSLAASDSPDKSTEEE